jgi:hypothetical protein
MMFLVIFGALAAAMAVVAQGNLRSADSALRVSRAHSAAETGLVFAARRLEEAARRFVVTRGLIDAEYAQQIWNGPLPSDVSVGDPDWPAGYQESAPPQSLAEAVLNAHLAEQLHVPTHTFCPAGDEGLPAIDGSGTLLVCPIALSRACDPPGSDDCTANPDGPHFRLAYAPVPDQPYVRVTSVGTDGHISRTLKLWFRLDRRIEYAVLTPNRLMIGKNVRIEGPLGTGYGTEPGELEGIHGHPLVMRSDFEHLDASAGGLDERLAELQSLLPVTDLDGDNRLMRHHPIESAGLPPELNDYDGDEYVDDLDLFLERYDADGDGAVVYDPAAAFAAGYAPGLQVEFAGDRQLALLVDGALPDRDGDGLVSPCDGTAQGTDCRLGYLDGVVDALDRYAKVRGRLVFSVRRDDWEQAQGDLYQTVVHGPIHPGYRRPPVTFEAPPQELRLITTDMVGAAAAWYDARAANDFIDAWPPDAWQIEPMPWGSPGAYDDYERPVWSGRIFDDVRIPMGTNALFSGCMFRGVTFIETTAACTDPNWNYVGAMECDDQGDCTPKYPALRVPWDADPDDPDAIADTRPLSNNIRFHDCVFVGALAGTVPEAYAHWRNKVQLTGSSRFYLEADDPGLDQEPPAVREAVLAALAAWEPGFTEQMRRSSILLPGWSCDIGNFGNDEQAPVRLRGTIIAGILDLRGSVEVHGTLLMTYRPVDGEGPLHYGGLPAAFNTTIGYFGPSQGDGEGTDYEDPDFGGFGRIVVRYDPEAIAPDGIPWPLRARPDPLTYFEGR